MPNRLVRLMESLRRPLSPGGMGSAVGLAQSRLMARWIGWIAMIAGGTALISLLFPAAPYASVGLSTLATLLALAAAPLLLLGALDRLAPEHFPWVLAVLIAIAALGVYAGGSPTSGAQFFFVWASPIAFGFFSTRKALAEMAWIGVIYAAVLTLQVHEHPGIGSPGLIFGMWIIVVVTAFAIGVLVRRFSRQLRDTDRRFEFAFSESPIGAGFLDRDLVWLEVNGRLCEILETDRSELVGSLLEAWSHPGDAGLTESVLTALGDETAHFRTRFSLASGRTAWASISAARISPEIGDPYIFCQIVDVTEFVLAVEALEEQTIHDPLTGLFNRALLLDRLSTALRNRRARGGEVAVALLDLDHFKVVNDSLGHLAGDEILRLLAPRLLAAVDASDTFARLGGDEFVLLCEGIRNPLDALDRASRLNAVLATPVELTSGSRHVLTGSIGVAVAAGEGAEPEALLRDADAAMYRAKAAGRDRIEIFDRSMREAAIARLELEAELRHAIADGELDVAFQPVVDVQLGRPVLLEALCRWHHPERGTLVAGEFIPIAEETGLISELGTFVLTRALETLARLQRELPMDPPLRLSVNVSGRQLASGTFPDQVATILRNVDIIPGTLAIEITESVLLTSDMPAATLGALKDLGIVLMLDDFGTGYSSLSYLEQFPVDALKIDQSFVARLHDEASHALLEAIMAMGRALSLEVIAEGAETEEQVRLLRELGCNYVQGHAISLPLPPDRVAAFLEGQLALACGLDGTAH